MSTVAIYKITLEVTAGHIHDVAYEMGKLANQFNCPVNTMFNDTLLEVQPNQNLFTALEQWEKRRVEQRKLNPTVQDMEKYKKADI